MNIQNKNENDDENDDKTENDIKKLKRTKNINAKKNN